MGKFIDLTGKRFGRLIVLRLANKRFSCGKPVTYWECKCDCSKIIEVSIGCLRNGHTKSCGCLLLEVSRRNGIIVGNLPKKGKHNKSHSKIYETWCNIKSRCHRKNATGYYLYGGRGITVCERWRSSFTNFLIDMGEPPNTFYSIERIDNDGNYNPGNCKWALINEQSSNKRNNHYITYKGETKIINEWARLVNIPFNTIIYRLKNGWSEKEALTLRPYANDQKIKINYKGKKISIVELSDMTGIKYATLYARYKNGWNAVKLVETLVR